MKFLADMGVSMSTVKALRQREHDAVHLRDQGLIRMEDAAIVAKARGEDRVILTFDLDFGEIMAHSGTASPSVILFRTRNQTPQYVTPRLLRLLEECPRLLAVGASSPLKMQATA